MFTEDFEISKQYRSFSSLRSMAVLVGRALRLRARISRLRRSCARLDKTAMLRRLLF